MSRFFVGQRVRLVRPFYPENMGATGVINAMFQETRVRGGLVNCNVAFDVPVRGTDTHTSDLEPILPEGHKPCEEQFKRDLDRLLEREGVSA